MLADELKEIREAGLLLGFQEGDQVDLKAVRRSYTKFAHDWHPDHATSNGVSAAEANAKMVAGNKAFSVLKKAAENNGGTVRIPKAQEAGPEPTHTSQGNSYSYQGDYSTGRDDRDEPTDYDRPTWTMDNDAPDPHSGFNHQASTSQSNTTTQNNTAQSNTSQTSASPDYKPTWLEVFEDIFDPLVDWPIRMASPPQMLLFLINLAIEGFFVFLLIESFKIAPGLVILSIPVLIGMVWLYRKIARLVFQIAEVSDLLALAIDVSIIVFIWWRYGAWLVSILSPYLSNLPFFSASS